MKADETESQGCKCEDAAANHIFFSPIRDKHIGRYKPEKTGSNQKKNEPADILTAIFHFDSSFPFYRSVALYQKIV